MNRIPFSILKNNKLFSISLLSIYVMVTVILVMLTFFYPSVKAGIEGFLNEYGLPDATIVTQAATADKAEIIEGTEGIQAVDAVITVEGKTTLPCGDIRTLRYSNIPQSDRRAYYNTDTEEDVQLDDRSVLISSKFAEKNDVNAGDALLVSVNGESISLKVTDVVSCPDTIYVARDVNSWFDDTQYGFVYVSEEIMSSEFKAQGIANVFELWFENGTNGEKTLASASARLENAGVSVESATLAKDSTVYYQIHSSLDGTKAVITYLPVLIFLMGLLFCGFFIYQVIGASSRTIGILQAIGAGTGRICGIFIMYSMILCTAALILGFALGVPVLYVFLNVYKGIFVLPQIVWAGNAKNLLLVVLAVYSISILSCLVCVRAISGNDPAVLFAGSGSSGSPKESKIVHRIRLGAYMKITVAALFRNKRRLALMTFCNVACLLLTFLSLSVLSSKASGMDFMFNERFDYDYIVIAQDADTMKSVSELSEVDASEKAAAVVFNYEDEYMRIEALCKDPELTAVVAPDGTALTVPDDGIILEEGFARRHNLSEGDTVDIDGISLTVSSISREYFYSTQYISFKTAKKLGAPASNVMYLRLENADEDAASLEKQLSNMDGVECFYSVSERRASAVSSMRAIDAPCYLFVVLGILIGLVIVSNMNIHSIQQRKKEFATLKVLGTSGSEFYKMFLFEIFIQYVLCIIPGMLISIPASRWILQKMSSISMEFVPVHVWCVAIAASGAVMLYLLLSLISAKRTVDRLDLPEILAKR